MRKLVTMLNHRSPGGRTHTPNPRDPRTRGYACPARAQSTRHPNQSSGHPSQCSTPKHHSLLQPRLPDPCHLRGPRVGGMATSPLPSRGSPTRGQKMGKRGGNWGEIGGNFAWRAQCTTVLSHTQRYFFFSPLGTAGGYWWQDSFNRQRLTLNQWTRRGTMRFPSVRILVS